MAQTGRVTIRVDASARKGPMTPMWAWFGYDEPNYTYMKDGKKLLSELAALSPVPVFVRAHNLLTTGDGTPALKWGSTNAYTEDASGRPQLRLDDRRSHLRHLRRAEDEAARRDRVHAGSAVDASRSRTSTTGRPALPYNRIYTGWTLPAEGLRQVARADLPVGRATRVEQYGQREVESWYWEVWNEPDIGYWSGTPEEFQKLYDYAADGLKRALPTARIGGPHVTGPNGARTQEILREFLEHCLRGTNYATGKIGTPLDFVGFHAKGAPRVVDGHVRMGDQQPAARHRQRLPHRRVVSRAEEHADHHRRVRSRRLRGLLVATNPENAYRNGTMYSSYTAAQIARTYELADLHKVNLLGSVTWAFEFEDQPYFAGFRDLATNGIDKPVLNVFRMLGQMRGDRADGREQQRRAAGDDSRQRRARAARRLRARVAERPRDRGPGLELSRRRSAGAAGGDRPDRSRARRTARRR